MQKYSGKQWCRDISEIVHTGSAVFADSTGGVEVSRDRMTTEAGRAIAAAALAAGRS